MKTKNNKLFLVLLILFISCQKQENIPEIAETTKTIIPAPVSFTITDDFCSLPPFSGIANIGIKTEKMESMIDVFNVQAEKLLGYSFRKNAHSDSSFIKIKIENTQSELGQEGYKMNIEKEGILIASNTDIGAFYGMQSLLQLLVPHQNSTTLWASIPTGEIIDYPRYAYRGLMLDASRGFIEVGEVKKFIDVMALYKMNYLHLHLTDDHGWRIAIDAWPNLTTIGSHLNLTGNKEGFYTKADYKEIIEYASQKNITIVPEIDMPGHSGAALNSYAELNKNDKIKPVPKRRLFLYTKYLHLDKPIVNKFVNDVIREVAEMTPGPYIHIGGDEVWTMSKKKYKESIDQIREIVHNNGKTMIGWNEIVHSSLDEGDIVQHWKRLKKKHGTMAANNGNQLIMSYNKYAYLDYVHNRKEERANKLFHFIGNNITSLKKSYHWDPGNLLKDVTDEDILGVETCMWTVFSPDLDDIEEYVFPRFLSLAETTWSLQGNKDWEDFRARANKHQSIMDKYSINYYKSKYLDW